jgi:GxxExxY protein
MTVLSWKLAIVLILWWKTTVVVELKAIEALAPIHQAQIISYLKLSGKPIGLLINFHSLHLKDGIKRFVV